MAKTSNVLTTVLNVLTLLLGLVLIIAGIWTSVHPDSATLCEKTFAKPYIFTGTFLVALAVIGIVGAFFRINSMLYIYSAVLLIMIVGLLAYAIFALVVTNKRISKAVSNRGYKEYRLRDYSKWLQKHVVTDKNWANIKSCLIDSRVCLALARAKTSKDFYRTYLTPIESGCCKPPGNCKYLFVNSTYWVPPKTGPASDDSDCKSWNNDQKKLCYDCGSCQVGVLSNMRHLWRKFAMLNFSIIVFIIVIYSISCCAIKNNEDIPQPCHI